MLFRFLTILGFLTATFLVTRVSDAKSNIILVLTDDQGWSQLSESMDPRLTEARSDYLETPHMSLLVHRGMRFTSGYSPAPLCTPTRRSILCGTSAARSGPEFKSEWVPAEHMTIPKAIKSVDPAYRCAHFGKWGEQMISTPEECGYDASDGMTGNNTGGMPTSLGVKGGHENGPPHFIDNEDPKRTRSVTDKAIAFMRQNVAENRPFYVQISYYAQHLSVVTSEASLAKYEAKGIPDRGYTPAWAAMMEELDQGVGRLIDELQHQGIDDETYLFFTADNGGRGDVPGGDANRVDTNFPLTGSKHSLYEGGIRVPFIAIGPGIPKGTICRTPVVGYDFLPTFMELAGGDASTLSDEVDGVSLKPVLRQPDVALQPRQAGGLIFHRPERLFSAIRAGDEKLMLFWRRDGEVSERELYRVDVTPTEEGHDLAADEPTRAEALQAKLLGYLDRVNADQPQPTKRKSPKNKAEGKANTR